MWGAAARGQCSAAAGASVTDAHPAVLRVLRCEEAGTLLLPCYLCIRMPWDSVWLQQVLITCIILCAAAELPAAAGSASRPQCAARLPDGARRAGEHQHCGGQDSGRVSTEWLAGCLCIPGLLHPVAASRCSRSGALPTHLPAHTVTQAPGGAGREPVAPTCTGATAAGLGVRPPDHQRGGGAAGARVGWAVSVVYAAAA